MLFNGNKNLEQEFIEKSKFIKKHPWVSTTIGIIVILPYLWGAYASCKGWQIAGLKEKISNLEKENLQKDAEIQRLETLLTPFRTIALAQYAGPETEALSKLALKIKDLEGTVMALQDYSDIAKLDSKGLPPISVSGPLKISTNISNLLEGTFKEENGQIQFLCNPDCEAKYRKVIEKYPDFPFAYAYLSKCLYARGDENWKIYAQKALDIFKKTTLIKGHPTSQDDVARALSTLLNENK